MHPTDEMMIQLYLPSMRQIVALKLRGEGLSQAQIAKLLGITQASVSIYLSTKANRAYDSLSSFGVQSVEADRLASSLASATREGAEKGVSVLHSQWTRILGSGAACSQHRKMYPDLANCDFCIKEYGQETGDRGKAIADVEDAIKLLETSETFVKVMPEVSVNIARAAEEAKTSSDVVAIPGRLVLVKNRARAMLPPEFGASVHMARILLLSRTEVPAIRACINLTYDEKMERTLEKMDLDSISLKTNTKLRHEDPTVAALEEALKKHPRFTAVVDKGGSGVEPNTYLFGKTAKEVALLAVRVSRIYSSY